MKTMTAAKFQEQCLAVLDSLGPEGLLITKRGRPVAHLMPVIGDHAELIGSLHGRIMLKGNLLSTGTFCVTEC